MTINISTERVGTRVYVTGNTFAVKDQLKQAGCHWDSERKQWWIGAAKADAIGAIVGNLDGHVVKPQIGSDTRVLGKVIYKGKNYYAIHQSRDGAKLHLTVLDGSIDFWADAAACQWSKRYEPRTRTYRGHTTTEHQTLGGLKRFIERSRAEQAAGKPAWFEGAVRCRHCGEWAMGGDDWCTQCGKADYER